MSDAHSVRMAAQSQSPHPHTRIGPSSPNERGVRNLLVGLDLSLLLTPVLRCMSVAVRCCRAPPRTSTLSHDVVLQARSIRLEGEEAAHFSRCEQRCFGCRTGLHEEVVGAANCRAVQPDAEGSAHSTTGETTQPALTMRERPIHRGALARARRRIYALSHPPRCCLLVCAPVCGADFDPEDVDNGGLASAQVSMDYDDEADVGTPKLLR